MLSQDSLISYYKSGNLLSIESYGCYGRTFSMKSSDNWTEKMIVKQAVLENISI